MKELKEIGLSKGQIQVYSAILTSGSSSVNKIQEKTGIERRNIYDILNKLIEKGFVSYTIEKNKKVYQSTHPNKIKQQIKEKKQSLTNLQKQIPDFIKLFNQSKLEIRAEVLRGNESIKAIMEEMLDHKESFWIGGNSGVEHCNENMRIWFKHWMQRRADKKHKLHDLADYGTYLKDFGPKKKAKYKKKFYERQQLPKDLSSPMVIAIFSNKVVQILWSQQPFAFVLESKEIKDSFKKYFDYFWKK